MQPITYSLVLELEKQLPPPAASLKGRRHKRVPLDVHPHSEKSLAFAIQCHRIQHVTHVSIRKTINRFNKIGYPKEFFCSPEFADALKYGITKPEPL